MIQYNTIQYKSEAEANRAASCVCDARCCLASGHQDSCNSLCLLIFVLFVVSFLILHLEDKIIKIAVTLFAS